MDKIIVSDLEVFFHIGVTGEERARPQRLLITLELRADVHSAAASDNLGDTIDYHAVCQRVLRFGDGCHWQLIETLAADLAAMILEEFRPADVEVEVKKFVVPQARYVAVRIIRPRRE